jgi:Ca-activated chloride channel family protein
VKTVVLLVDVSGSMRAQDLRPTRLGAAVTAMRAFVDRLPAGVAVGLVSFSSDAKVVQPPTLDRARIGRGLASLEPQAGTALGNGLARAIALATRESGRYLPAAIVLESDGAQNRGRVQPLDAAHRAKAAGIRVYGVALGTRKGSVKFAYGKGIPVPPDAPTVRAVADATGGASYVATDTGRLAAAYLQIASRLS